MKWPRLPAFLRRIRPVTPEEKAELDTLQAEIQAAIFDLLAKRDKVWAGRYSIESGPVTDADRDARIAPPLRVTISGAAAKRLVEAGLAVEVPRPPTRHVTMALPAATAQHLVDSGRAVYAEVDNGPALDFQPMEDAARPVPDYSEAAAAAVETAKHQRTSDMLTGLADALDAFADGAKALAETLPPPPLSSLLFIDGDGLHAPDRSAIADNVRAAYVAEHGQPDAQDQQMLDVMTDSLDQSIQATARVFAALSPGVLP